MQEVSTVGDNGSFEKDSDFSMEQFGENSIDVRKRQTFFENPLKKLREYTTRGTEALNLCAAASNSKIFCVLNSLISKSESIKHLVWTLPSVTGIMCLLANSVFTSMPKKLFENKKKVLDINQFLKLFDVKKSDQADFAKSAANALIVSLIKNLNAGDFNDLKPLIDNLELKDLKKSKSKSSSNMGSMFPNFQWDSMGKGSWINSQCKNMEASSPASILANAMKKRPCLSDTSLPGYFVFNRLPTTAWTQPILPVLRAWNSPLLLMTGSKCCMIPFAEKNKRQKCVHKYALLDKPHGLPLKSGPSFVCGSIASLSLNRKTNDSADAIPATPCDYPEFNLIPDYGAGDPCATEKPVEVPDIDYTEFLELPSEPEVDPPEYNEEDGRSADLMIYD